MPEINPENKNQMKKHNITKIIHAGDRVEYTLTEKAPTVAGSKGKPGKEKAGSKHWGHPNVVEKFVNNGWAKLTGESDLKKMPEAQEK